MNKELSFYKDLKNFTKIHPTIYKFEYNNKYYVTSDNIIINSTTFDYIHTFINDFCKVELDGKVSFIGLHGKRIAKFYDNAYTFYNNFARVCKNNKWSLIDKFGIELTDFKYDVIHDMTNGFAKVGYNNKFTFIDEFGKEFNKTFDDVKEFNHGFSRVLINNRWYIIDEKQKVYNISYDDIFYVDKNIIYVRDNDKMFFIDWNENIIPNDKILSYLAVDEDDDMWYFYKIMYKDISSPCRRYPYVLNKWYIFDDIDTNPLKDGGRGGNVAIDRYLISNYNKDKHDIYLVKTPKIDNIYCIVHDMLKIRFQKTMLIKKCDGI